MNWKKWILTTAAILFVGSNFFLLFKKESPVNRLTYVRAWTTVTEQNLTMTKEAQGLVAPVKEEYFYHEDDFKAFLVKEGDQVDPSTPLFERSTINVDAEITKRESEIERLEDEISAVEDNIDNLESLLDDTNVSTTPETEAATEATARAIEVEMYDKERQLSQLKAQLTQQETLLDQIDTNTETATINAGITGTVKEIRPDLSDPIMTIASKEVKIEALVTEQEINQISEGMKVQVTSPHAKNKLAGTIEQIAELPANKPTLKKEAQYAYSVQLEDAAAELLIGSQVNLKIITNEIEDALTVPTKVLKQRGTDVFTYVLLPSGIIERRIITPGIHMNKVEQVTKGLVKGEYIVRSAKGLKDGNHFYTPLNVKKVTLKGFGKKEALKQWGKGFLSN